MSFFNQLFKRQGQQNDSALAKSDSNSLDSKSHNYKISDTDFIVRIKTDQNLSEEQQNTIFSIIKDGVYLNNEVASKVCVMLMLSIGITNPMTLNRTSEDSVELIF